MCIRDSSNGKSQATLDHIVVSDLSLVQTMSLVQDVTQSDHHALLCSLKEEVGCWNAGQHQPVVLRPRLILDDLDNLAPMFH